MKLSLCLTIALTALSVAAAPSYYQAVNLEGRGAPACGFPGRINITPKPRPAPPKVQARPRPPPPPQRRPPPPRPRPAPQRHNNGGNNFMKDVGNVAHVAGDVAKKVLPSLGLGDVGNVIGDIASLF